MNVYFSNILLDIMWLCLFSDYRGGELREIMSDENVLLTQSILIRGLTKKQYNVLVDISLKLNSLRNCAVEKTPFVKSTDKKHFKKINFKPIINKVKEEFKMEYSFLQAHLANAAIKKHVESFNSYVELKNKKLMVNMIERLIRLKNIRIIDYITL